MLLLFCGTPEGLCLPLNKVGASSSVFFLHSALATWPSVSKIIPSIKKKVQKLLARLGDAGYNSKSGVASSMFGEGSGNCSCHDMEW